MSKKKILTLETAFTGALFGLVTPVKEYQLSWHLNRTLGIDLKRNNDIEIIHKKKSKTSLFSLYRYEDDLDKLTIHVISNKHQGDFLIPEVKQADYFLMIKGEISEKKIEELRSKMKSIPVIQMIAELSFDQLKSAKNLIVE